MTASSYSRYQETAAGCAVDLSDNTNLWGAPPAVDRVLRRIASDGLSRYPSAYSSDLKRAIATYVGVDESMIVVGCGSDDVLDSAIRAFGAPNDLLVQADPTISCRPVEDLSRCSSPRTRVSSSLVSLRRRARTSAMSM